MNIKHIMNRLPILKFVQLQIKNFSDILMGDCFLKTFHAMKQHDDDYNERNRMKYKFFYNRVMIELVSLIS